MAELGATSQIARDSLAELFTGSSGFVERMPMLRVVFNRAATACTEGLAALADPPPHLALQDLESGTAGDLLDKYDGKSVAGVLHATRWNARLLVGAGADWVLSDARRWVLLPLAGSATIRWRDGDGTQPPRLVPARGAVPDPATEPDEVDEELEVDDDDIETAIGEIKFDVELVQDVIGNTARAVLDRVGDVSNDLGDYLDNLRWQVPRLRRLRNLRDDTSISLGRTLARWRSEILNHHRTGASNGPTEGLNLLIKKVKRAGHGFRSFANYRLRILLHAGGVRRITVVDARPPGSRRRSPSPR